MIKQNTEMGIMENNSKSNANNMNNNNTAAPAATTTSTPVVQTGVYPTCRLPSLQL